MCTHIPPPTTHHPLTVPSHYTTTHLVRCCNRPATNSSHPPPPQKKKGGVWACTGLYAPREPVEPATTRPRALQDTARRPVTRRRASDLRRSLTHQSVSRDAMHAAPYILLYLHDDDPGCRQHSNCKRTSRAARLADDDDAARFVSLRSRPGSLRAPPSFAAPATHRTHIPAPSQPACPFAHVHLLLCPDLL